LRIAAAILAGGQGSRIGGDKPLRILAGQTLLDRAIQQARQWSDIVFVVVRDHMQVGDATLDCILDEPGIEGPLAGLAAALRRAKALGCEAVLTVPADMPFLPADLCERLTAELGGQRSAIPSSGGHLHPVCGLWRIAALDGLGDYLASGRRSLKGFAEAVGFRAVEWLPVQPHRFFNINSALDLAAAERLIAGNRSGAG
jgi:molybdopterin-guanine dinucleotide biosynthesis protein A